MKSDWSASPPSCFNLKGCPRHKLNRGLFRQGSLSGHSSLPHIQTRFLGRHLGRLVTAVFQLQPQTIRNRNRLIMFKVCRYIKPRPLIHEYHIWRVIKSQLRVILILTIAKNLVFQCDNRFYIRITLPRYLHQRLALCSSEATRRI